MPTLSELLSQSKSDIEEISKYFNELLAEAIQRVNADFSPHVYPSVPVTWSLCQRISVNYPVIELELGQCLNTL